MKKENKNTKTVLIISLIIAIVNFLFLGYANYQYNKLLENIDSNPNAEIEVSPYLYEASFGEYLPLIITNTGDFTLRDVYIRLDSCEMPEDYGEQYFLPLLPAHSERVIPFGNKNVIKAFKKGNCYPFSGTNRSIAGFKFNIGSVMSGKNYSSSSVGCGVCYFTSWIIGNYTDRGEEMQFKKQINSSFTFPVELTFSVSQKE